MAFTIKESDDIINDIIVNIVSNVSQVSDVNPGSVLRQLTEAIGTELYDIYQEIEDVYDGTRILTAESTDLDNLGALVGVTRTAGTAASGTATFLRETVATSDFTISAGSIISTNPALGTQYKYTVTAATTFDSDISNDSNDYIEGVFKYPLSERFVGSITTLDGTSGAAGYTFAESTDFDVEEVSGEYLPDTESLVEIDDCDATTGWVADAGATAIATNNVNNVEGTNDLELGKSTAVATNTFYYKQLGAAINNTSKRNFIWIYITDAAALAKLDSLTIRISSDTTPTNNYYQMELSNLAVGMNMYNVYYGDSTTTQTGFPNTDTINSIRIDINTNNAADTLTAGDIEMDFWFATTSATAYYGDVISWTYATGTLPDTATAFETDWKPLSVDVAVSAEAIGTNYNVAAGQLTYRVSYVANVTGVYNYYAMAGGTDEEEDDDYRTRIQGAASAAGNATTEALEQALLALDGVQSVLVDDLPTQDIYGPTGGVRTQEPHIMYTAVGDQKLDYEVVYLDDTAAPTNIIVADAYDDVTPDYTYGTASDYYLDSDTNKIIWDTSVPGTTCPTNGASYYVGYQANWVGHVQIYVAGYQAPLSSSVETLIDAAIAATKAAGVQVDWEEATVNYVNITCTVTVDTAAGYNESEVKTNVQTALITWLNNMDIADDVLVAAFYEEVMTVDGVTNVVITDWDGNVVAPFVDVSIGDSEVARPEDSGITVN